jgi:hypothetical protein
LTRTLVQAAAAAVVLVFLWKAFRLAMGLRAERLFREGTRRAEEARGHRVIAEIPSAEGELSLFVEAGDSFVWQDRTVRKSELLGCRLLLNGAAVASAARVNTSIPEAALLEDYEGRERWDVRVYAGTGVWDIPCGTLREGVSRDAARAVFEAVSAALPALR